MARAQDTLKVGNISAPIVSKGMGTQEILGGSASKRYTVGKYFVGNDGYYYLVSQTIERDATITVGTNCTKTDLAAEIEGKAPTNHASAQTTYGVGDANNYGHVKVDASPTANSTNALQSGGAKSALDGKAPTSHASSNTTYGVGSTTNYGHVKVDDALSDSSTNPVQNKKVKAAVDEVKQALSNEVATRAELGAHNLFDINSATEKINATVQNYGFTNTATDTRDTFRLYVSTRNSSDAFIEYIVDNKVISATGKYSYNVTIPNGTATISVIHGGQNTNFSVKVPVNLEAGNYIISFDVNGYNPSTVGGLDVRNIMIRKATDANADFEPYAMTNQQLTNVVEQTQDNYIVTGTQAISVTADGSKTFKTMLNELYSAITSWCSNNLGTADFAEIKGLFFEGIVDTLPNSYKKATKTTLGSFYASSISTLTNKVIIYDFFIHSSGSGYNRTEITTSGTTTITDYTSSVVQSGRVITATLLVYKKVS